MKITKSLMKRMLLLLPGILFLISCNKNKNCVPAPDISNISLELQLERVDQELFNIQSKNDLAQIIRQNPVFSEVFLMRSQYPHDSILVDRFYNLLHDPSIDTLWQETQQVFGDLKEVENQFVDAFKRIKYFYPDFTVPRIKTVFSGLSQDMYLSDTLIIIGLDYYLGNDATFRPLNTPEYILKRYRKENIVPNTLLFISEKYNQTNPDDQSLLADMIYYGKSYYFSKQMLPCVPDSIFLGYTPREMIDIQKNEGIIWANFIENELLYETNHFIKDKFISERPYTYEINQNCPGRIGRWIGWEMIKEYHEKNEDLSFPGIMANPDAREIFIKSKYKPRI
jgi:gliding motility-associated lipoprotein GldB